MAAANKIKFTLADCGFALFALSVVLMPIGFGGNRPLPFGAMQAGLALSCVFLLLGRKELIMPRLFPRLKVALVLMAIVVTWAFLQAQPIMPGGWSHPLWREAGDVLGQPLHGTIAISPEDSLVGLGRLVTYIAVGLLAYIFAQEPKRARRIVAALWISSAVIGCYGLFEFIHGGHKILWFDKWAYQEDVTGTFINRNHFAVYAGMGLICGVALLIQSWRESVATEKPHLRARAMHMWFVKSGSLRIFSLLVILLCIVMSHSRAGLVLSVGGVGAYLILYQIYHKEFGRAFITLLAAFVVLAIVVVAARQYSDRFAMLFTDYSSKDRATVYGLTMQAIHDNPWLGYGLNGFQPVFRIYQRGMIMEFTHAHSDMLESLLDLGIPMGLTMWASIGLLVSGLARGVARRRRHGMFPVLGIAATIIVIGHSMVDFSLQIPGVVVPWAMLLGTGLAQSWRQEEKEAARGWDE